MVKKPVITQVADGVYKFTTMLIDARRCSGSAVIQKSLAKFLADDDAIFVSKATESNEACTVTISGRGVHLKEAFAVLISFGPGSDNGVVAHECMHAVEQHMTRAGMPPAAENEEARAYYLGWLTNKVTAFLEKNDAKEKEAETKGKKNARQRTTGRTPAKSK